MPNEDITDVNTTESASSNDSSTTGAVVEKQDVNANSSDSSTDQAAPPDKAEKSLEQVVKDAFEKSTAPVEKEGQDKEKPPVTDKELVEGGEEKVEKDEKGPIPYERFQEVNSQKVELETKWKEAEPLVEAQKSVVDFCQKNDIAPEEFQFWLDIAAKAKNNPLDALKALDPHIKQFKAFQGDELAPDLQAAVDAGEMTLPMAKRLQAAESQKNWNEQQTKKSQERQQAQLQHRYQEEMKTSLVSWAESKGKIIPDFMPKKAGQDDGIFELFIHKYMADAPKAQIQDQKGLTAFAEKTLESVLKSVKRFSPAATTTNKVLRTSQTNNGASSAPKNLDEVVKAAARRHGIVT